MKYIADFHIHSHQSIATSKNLIPEYLEYWARLKGINVVGTGDCVHPGWLKELKEKLQPAGNGLYRLKHEYRLKNQVTPAQSEISQEVFFILTGEISNIYKSAGKVRKVHNLCVFPDFVAVENLQKKLMKIGNITSDGRPILGMDSRDLLEMVLESSDVSYLIPAHIWTPWFSVLGSKSGFDNVKDCYRDLAEHIFAVETGLSSDPPMNRACSFLDRFKLVSNSDAHSPENLGREANLFDADIDYEAIYNALKDGKGFLGTIEFFPQEGKYHYDGHRNCNVCWDPLETVKHRGICSVCKKPVTKGVMYRVAELADRTESEKSDRNEFYSITPLPRLIAEILRQRNKSGKAVQAEYFRLIEKLGPEFHVLLFADKSRIKKDGSGILAEGIHRLRDGKVHIEDGYDGEFGRIKVFNDAELDNVQDNTLFSDNSNQEEDVKHQCGLMFNISEFKELYQKTSINAEDTVEPVAHADETNTQQKQGVEHLKGPCMILAGPGSGKTRILTERIKFLVEQKGVLSENILAITFSNKAAEEMRKRLKGANTIQAKKMNVMTFHAFGLSVLKEHFREFGRNNRFYIIDEEEKQDILESLGNKKIRDDRKKFKRIEDYKQGIDISEEILTVVETYDKLLKEKNAFDLDDLIYLPVKLFAKSPDVLGSYRRKYQWLLVDEYQDINARQYELLRLLAGEGNPSLFVIGDPDQAIYGFRGSDVRYIDKLKVDYPSLKTIYLKRSYRCPSVILKVAAQVLKKNSYLEGKPENIKIHVQSCDTDKAEADWIAMLVEKMIGGVRSYSLHSGVSDGEAAEGIRSFSDFGVLCRTAIMFDCMAEAFNNHGIPCQIIGSEPLQNKEPFRSAINLFRKIFYIEDIGHDPGPLSERVLGMLKEKQHIFRILTVLLEGKESPQEELKRMEQMLKTFKNDYLRFFEDISLRQSIDDYDERAEAVSLMTLHASKGLEFNTVFIPGCEEGIIPFELFGNKDKEELNQEERLFYVGITRSKKNLFLSHAKTRYFKGRILHQQKSRFLDRMEKELLRFETRERKRVGKVEDKQLGLF